MWTDADIIVKALLIMPEASIPAMARPTIKMADEVATPQSTDHSSNTKKMQEMTTGNVRAG